MTAIRSVDSLKYGVRLFGYLLTVLVVGGGLLALGLELGYSEATDLAGAGTLSTISTTDLAAGGVLSFLGSFVLLTGLFGVVHKLVADSVAVGVEAGTPAQEPEPVANDTESDMTESEPETPDTSSESADPPAETVPPANPAVESPTDKQPTGAEPPAEQRSPDPESSPGSTATDQPNEPEMRKSSLAEMFEESDGAEHADTSEPAQPDNGDTVQAPAHHVEPSSTAAVEQDDQVSPPDGEQANTAADDERRDPPREPTPEEIAFGTTDEDANEMSAADESEAATDEERTSSTSTKSVGNSSGKDPLADPDDE